MLTASSVSKKNMSFSPLILGKVTALAILSDWHNFKAFSFALEFHYKETSLMSMHIVASLH